MTQNIKYLHLQVPEDVIVRSVGIALLLPMDHSSPTRAWASAEAGSSIDIVIMTPQARAEKSWQDYAGVSTLAAVS